jgi:hypothetical protein
MTQLTTGTDSATASAAPAPRRRHRLAVAIGALAAVTLVGSVDIEPAAAWYAPLRQGATGAVTLPQVRVMDVFYNWTPVLTFDSVTGPRVNRAVGTTGAQEIVASYAMEKWNGAAWVTVTSRQYVAYLSSAQTYATFPRLSFAPTSGAGYYRVAWAIVWKAYGRNLGYVGILPDRTSDLGCITTRRPCQVSAGHVRVGRLYQLGGGW